MRPESVPQPVPAESDARIDLFGTFISPDVESAFRQQHLRDDLWLCCFLVIAATLRVSLLIVADYQHIGAGPLLWPMLVGRALFVLISGWTLSGLRRVTCPATADRLFVGWAVLLGALTISSIAARSPDNNVLLFLSFGVVVVTYCVTPLPLPTQAAIALTYSAGALLVSHRADSGVLLTVGSVYVVAHVFGIVASWRLNHRRREAYLGTLREAELRTGLEAALTEIRTLRGLLCICAWCKRVRDEEAAWQSVEKYVSDHTHAEFSHGICPDCMKSQFGNMAHAGH